MEAKVTFLYAISPRSEGVLFEDCAYPAHGVPSADTDEAIRLAARTEGMMTDPVYEVSPCRA